MHEIDNYYRLVELSWVVEIMIRFKGAEKHSSSLIGYHPQIPTGIESFLPHCSCWTPSSGFVPSELQGRSIHWIERVIPEKFTGFLVEAVQVKNVIWLVEATHVADSSVLVFIAGPDVDVVVERHKDWRLTDCYLIGDGDAFWFDFSNGLLDEVHLCLDILSLLSDYLIEFCR